MRVMFLSSYDRWRGGEAVLSGLSVELARRGHAVSLLCRSGSRLAEHFASRGAAEAGGVRLVTARLRGEVNPPSYFEVARALRAERPDVLLTNLNRDLLFGAPVARLLSVPLLHRYTRVDHPALDEPAHVGNSMNPEPSVLDASAAAATARPTVGTGHPRFGRARLFRAARLLRGARPGSTPGARSSAGTRGNPLYRALLRSWVEGCIVPSRFMRELLTSRFPEVRAVVVIHNGVDLARFRPDLEAGRRWRIAHGLSSDERVVGCVGALDRRHKGQHVLIAAAARARTPLRVVLAGIGPHEAELRALAGALGVNAIFVGFERQIEAAYNAFDVVALPSRMEAFGLTVVEAMACGRPVVSSDVASIPELLRSGEEGWLIPSDEPGALASAIDTLLDEPELRARLGAAARERVERDFSLEKMASHYEEALEAARQRRFSRQGQGA